MSGDAQAFYDERDDRTTRAVRARFHTAQVDVSINRRDAETVAGQLTLLAAVNLLARWCRHARFDVPNVPVIPHLRRLLPADSHDLAEGVLTLAAAIDPFGTWTRLERPSAPSSPTYRLVISSRAEDTGWYPVAGHGWCGGAGTGARGLAGDDPNPLGPVLAACMGVAAAFQSAAGLSQSFSSPRLSLWTLAAGEGTADGPRLPALELGEALLAGCGAVGSAIAYLLPLARLSGRVTGVDADLVELSNLNRCPLFSARDVGRKKVDVVGDYLEQADGIDFKRVPLWFDQALEQGCVHADEYNLILPVADERGVRGAIQAHRPRLQVYGTTGPDWQAFLARHIPGRDDCLLCRHPPELPKTVCALGLLTPSEHALPPQASMPFLPMAAAVLAVAELLAVRLAPHTSVNYACLDFRGPLDDLAQATCAPSMDCLCQRRVSRG